MARIIIHLKKSDIARDLEGWHLKLYQVIRAIGEETGIKVETRTRDPDITVGTRHVEDNRFEDGNLHIIDDRSVQAQNVLNAGVAYFWGFWHLDPKGVKAFSSIGALPYDPARIPLHRARPFFDRLRRRCLHKRISKYDQPAKVASFPQDAISVFFQGQFPVASGATSFDDMQMLRCVQAHAGERAIIVKPHPLVSDARDIQSARDIAAKDKRIIVTNANVHDILKSSCVNVSINSTVALEGFLHRKPAILFGKSDFHHFAGTVERPGDFGEVLARELERQGGYAQYLAWYFTGNCLSLNSDRLTDDIWRIFAEAGFAHDAFE